MLCLFVHRCTLIWFGRKGAEIFQRRTRLRTSFADGPNRVRYGRRRHCTAIYRRRRLPMGHSARSANQQEPKKACVNQLFWFGWVLHVRLAASCHSLFVLNTLREGPSCSPSGIRDRLNRERGHSAVRRRLSWVRAAVQYFPARARHRASPRRP